MSGAQPGLPKELEHDILFSDRVAAGIRHLVDGAGTNLELELRSPTTRQVFWVILTLTEPIRPNDRHSNMWHVDDATFTTPDRAVEGSCNGWFSTTPNPGAVAGKLTITVN